MGATRRPNRVDKSQTVPEISDPKVSNKRGRHLATVSKIKIPSGNFEVLISIRVLENFRPEIPSASAPIRLCTVRATRIEKSKMQIEKPAAPKRGVGKI